MMSKTNKTLITNEVFDGKLAQFLTLNHRDEIAWEEDGTVRLYYWPKEVLLSNRIVQSLEEIGVDVPAYSEMPPKLFYRCLCQAIRNLPQSTAKRFRLLDTCPRPGVHWVDRKSGSFFDFKTCDVHLELLSENEKKLAPGNRYLDFGCSSGRTIRSFWAGFPEVEWIGCDPVQKSITWARENFSEIEFICNDVNPPLSSIPDGSIAGAFANSVWSHFSERAAIEWLDEIHRVLAKGGFVSITVKSYTALLQRLIGHQTDALLTPNVLSSAIAGLNDRGFYFQPWTYEYSELEDQTDWSQSFIARSWLEATVCPRGWVLADYALGRWGNKQDIALLIKQ